MCVCVHVTLTRHVRRHALIRMYVCLILQLRLIRTEASHSTDCFPRSRHQHVSVYPLLKIQAIEASSFISLLLSFVHSHPMKC